MAEEEQLDAGHSTLKQVLKYAAIAFLFLLVVMLTWGLLEPYTLDRREYTAVIPGLPQSWQGQRIAVVGDFQIGMWMDNDQTVRRAVRAIVREQPAATLIVGDFVYQAVHSDGDEIATVSALLRPLRESGIPTFAILGNHDYGLSSRTAAPHHDLAATVERALEEEGVRTLINEAAPLELEDGEPLYIVGLGSYYAGNDNPQQALAGVPSSAARIVMMHHPDTFAKLGPQTAPLAVAGHTHGGQLRLPSLPDWSYLSFTREDEVHVDGWIEDGYGEAGNALYINRGIGMSLLPIRINAPPELTFFTLQ
ncbi:MAG: metallophosphoesterase [Chloroflexota bacterium]